MARTGGRATPIAPTLLRRLMYDSTAFRLGVNHDGSISPSLGVSPGHRPGNILPPAPRLRYPSHPRIDPAFGECGPTRCPAHD
ncbi:hypothetical protein GCM10009608_57590 [Pseudonocardia alaniniphila]